MDQEPDTLNAALLERLDLEAVKRRRPGAGIDLRLDARYAEFRQADPFAPAKCEDRVGKDRW